MTFAAAADMFISEVLVIQATLYYVQFCLPNQIYEKLTVCPGAFLP